MHKFYRDMMSSNVLSVCMLITPQFVPHVQKITTTKIMTDRQLFGIERYCKL